MAKRQKYLESALYRLETVGSDKKAYHPLVWKLDKPQLCDKMTKTDIQGCNIGSMLLLRAKLLRPALCWGRRTMGGDKCEVTVEFVLFGRFGVSCVQACVLGASGGNQHMIL